MTVPLERRADPTSRALVSLAEREQRRFRNRNCRTRRGSVVHAVAWVPWVGDLLLPLPACRQPIGSLAVTGDLWAVAEEVTCRRCLTFTSAHRDAAHADLLGGQLELVSLAQYRARRRLR